MAKSTRKSVKRKSEDFIYELSDDSLVVIEDDTPASKIQKSDEVLDVSGANDLQIDLTDNKEIIVCEADENGETIEIVNNISDVEISGCNNSIVEEVVDIDNSFLTIDECDGEASVNCIAVENSTIVLDDSSEEGELVSNPVSTSTSDDVDAKIDECSDRAVPIKIYFENEKWKNQYENRFLRFLTSFSEFDVTMEENSININIKQIKVGEINSEVISLNESNSKSEVISLIGNNLKSEVILPKQNNSKSDVIFPKENNSRAKRELFVIDNTPSMPITGSYLKYTSKYSLVDNESEVRNNSAQVCFNCNGRHALKDCSQPRDHGRIANARQKYLEGKPKSVRYHLHEDQQYSHFLPGVISENLREKLGLQQTELPSFIYGMRVLGYPPGWLEEAKAIHSHLEIFGVDTKTLTTSNQYSKALDSEKIIAYPGFNVPLGKGMRDEYHRYQVLPYTKEMSKEKMVKYFEKVHADQLLQENQFPPQISTKNIQHKKNVVKKEIIEAQSLTELEEEKTRILAQLEKTSVEETPSKRTPVGTVKSTSFGTPILKSCSPYSSLPDMEKFSVGVSPVIDFENLPNSTGNYEKIEGILQKVRKTLKQLHSS